MKLFIFLSVVVFVISSCVRNKCEEPLNVRQSEIVVVFKDKTTGRYLYSEYNPLYNKDSLKVFDQYGNSLAILYHLDLIPNTSNRFYVLSFGNIYDDRTDTDAFNTEICKTYLIKYSYNEVDTVQACFKAKKTKCGSVFAPLKVYNKGQLLDNVQDKASAHVTITKN